MFKPIRLTYWKVIDQKTIHIDVLKVVLLQSSVPSSNNAASVDLPQSPAESTKVSERLHPPPVPYPTMGGFDSQD